MCDVQHDGLGDIFQIVVNYISFSIRLLFTLVGCNQHFQTFFDGSNFSPSSLSLALYASLWAFDGW